MAGYDAQRVPRGTSRRWEVLISDEESRSAPSPRGLSALDVRSEHRVLREIPESVLREIPLLGQGAALVRRHEYLDFHDPGRAAFQAEGGEVVRPGQRVAARAAMSDLAWEELLAACDRVARRLTLPRAG